MRYLLLFLLPIQLAAQDTTQPVNRPASDRELWRFGFGLEIGQHFQHETTVTYNSTPQLGFGLDVMGSVIISRLVYLRFMPRLSFESFNVNGLVGGNTVSTRVESTALSLPLDATLHLGRKNNLQPYVLAGGQLRNDLANKNYGWQPAVRGGGGLGWHLPYFTLNIEARMEHGALLQNKKDTSGWLGLIFSG